jgi:hypothetical protein
VKLLGDDQLIVPLMVAVRSRYAITLIKMNRIRIALNIESIIQRSTCPTVTNFVDEVRVKENLFQLLIIIQKT